MALGRQMNIIEGIVTSDVSKEKCIWGSHIVNRWSPLEKNKSDFILTELKVLLIAQMLLWYWGIE